MSKEDSKAPKVSFPLKPPGQAKVWNVVEVAIKGSDKPPIKFSIQEVPEDRYEDVLDHMCTYFIADEPICQCTNGKDDPEFVLSFRRFWTSMLAQGLTVGAFTEDPNGGKPILAGVNLLGLSFKDDDSNIDEIVTSERAKQIIHVMTKLSKTVCPFEKYGIDTYLTAMGLSVHPSYRGAALGKHILQARESIGREYNISVTVTWFTSPISQTLAERCNFENLVVRDYDDIVDEKGNKIFPGIESKRVRIMGKRLL
ncbi:PREDICTED: uncharacterized protein LOC107186893 [Dufourea novaeangliae]|uniref:N-acetyltransferase domain-containing protein n=1 Tax=Dufourea novaeangliae TaxID=178035 RepID=A0A154PA93_DUFNO|nr:PREDICTED: uncharacterized protein LOC107186893 [Dufourea novaeangliae]XP_015430339.1 PREDICTED: uncharacterized protein LOC107186893 [Dufourea novaeangliae]KZC08772.1 hypothetical protein WN55_10795 [Dufourea novaeangliae]